VSVPCFRSHDCPGDLLSYIGGIDSKVELKQLIILAFLQLKYPSTVDESGSQSSVLSRNNNPSPYVSPMKVAVIIAGRRELDKKCYEPALTGVRVELSGATVKATALPLNIAIQHSRRLLSTGSGNYGSSRTFPLYPRSA
jgi:hypothetical protein